MLSSSVNSSSAFESAQKRVETGQILIQKGNSRGVKKVQENVQHIRLCQAQKRLSTVALKFRGDVARSPKQGYQWPHKKGIMSSNYFF